MKKKIQALLEELKKGLVDRDEPLAMALLTVLSGENIVLVGPPGTAKSLIARRIADCLAHENDDGYFEYLLTKFSTPEEIFGPLSIAELKADRFKRNTAGYLPTVQVAFLDEIFKASSSILNALLTILNERIYHNGTEVQNVPLRALIAASNELPTEQEELNALYDRFLVRCFVDYVSERKLGRLFEKTEEPKLNKLTIKELDSLAKLTEHVTIPNEVREAILEIWREHKETFKEDLRESLSDRRLVKLLNFLRTSAVTNGRKQVDFSDVLLLKNCLWNHQENAVKVRDIVVKVLQTYNRPVQLLEKEVTNDTTTDNPPRARGKSGAVVKGFKGSGTLQDPLLIESVEELMDLVRPDVGLKGYYFRQTVDLDCSDVSTWPNIQFQGHYDGGGRTISYGKSTQSSSNNSLGGAIGIPLGGAIGIVAKMAIEFAFRDYPSLFASIHPQSSVTSLNLDNLCLADVAQGTHIAGCTSSSQLVKEEVSNCTITACQVNDSLSKDAKYCTISACLSGAALISGEATECTITNCQAGFRLVKTALKSVIQDCLVVWSHGAEGTMGGIVNLLADGSLVERCLVTGKINSGKDRKFFGVASVCNASTIRQCALGRLNLSSYDLGSRIAKAENQAVLENNAAIDTHRGDDEIHGEDGKTVAEVLFTQRYFELTLGWDFANVWQWDDQEDRPMLRSVGVGTTFQQAKSPTPQAKMLDLLKQQFSANIWL